MALLRAPRSKTTVNTAAWLWSCQVLSRMQTHLSATNCGISILPYLASHGHAYNPSRKTRGFAPKVTFASLCCLHHCTLLPSCGIQSEVQNSSTASQREETVSQQQRKHCVLTAEPSYSSCHSSPHWSELSMTSSGKEQRRSLEWNWA